MDHEDALALYCLYDVDHGGGDAAGLVNEILAGVISLWNTCLRIQLRNPDLVRNAALHSRCGIKRHAIIPFVAAFLCCLHRIETDAQVFDDIGEKGKIVNL